VPDLEIWTTRHPAANRIFVLGDCSVGVFRVVFQGDFSSFEYFSLQKQIILNNIDLGKSNE
jgi:hypothetical protein